MISGYFIGYLEKSKGYRFYYLNHNLKIIETSNARFIENYEVSRSDERNSVKIKKVRIDILLPISVFFIHIYIKYFI